MIKTVRDFLIKNALYIAFLQAWVAMLGSLYFSEILHWKPCLLCWYQRILMYPLTIILGVAIWRRDKNVVYYVLPMTIIGATIALYHYLLQMTPLKEITPIQCSSFGPCSEVTAIPLGPITLPYFMTIPFLSLTAFCVISLMMTILLKSKKKK